MPEYARLAMSRADSFTVSGKPRRSSISLRSALATLMRYSASDSCPAIATASVSSILAIFCVIFEPMKKPLLALLSEPSTTPSLVLMPTIVVISFSLSLSLGIVWEDTGLIDRQRLKPVTAETLQECQHTPHHIGHCDDSGNTI